VFSTRLRFVLVAAMLALAAYAARVGSLDAVLFASGALLLAVGYVRSGTVWLAFMRLTRGERDEAARLLDEVRWPARLAPGQRSYYELMRGAFAFDAGRFTDAIGHLEAARALPLRTEHVKAMAELWLARALYRAKADRARIDEALARARALRARRPIAVEIASLGLLHALDVFGALDGVVAVAGVTPEGRVLSKRGARPHVLRDRLVDVVADNRLPPDAAWRLASGQSVVAPFEASEDLVSLRLFATRRGFLLFVTHGTEVEALALATSDEARAIDARVAEVEGFEPESAPLDEERIGQLLIG
jgi:hypothetical protein